MADSALRVASRILLVESSGACKALLEQSFSQSGLPFELFHTDDPAEAPHLLVDPGADLLLISEVCLQACSVNLLELARTRPAGLPVFILGSDEGDETPAKYLREGASDYLTLRGGTLARLPFLAARAVEGYRARRRLDLVSSHAVQRDRQPMAVGSPILAALAHDMRSPLTGLMAMVDLLESGVDGALTPAQEARLRRVRAVAERLAAIAQLAGDLALLGAGKLPLSRRDVDLAEVAHLVRRDLEPVTSTHAVDLQLRIDTDLPKVKADAVRLRQILTLLLTAAVKRFDAGTLELQASARDSLLEVTLREGTRGIPVEALPAEFGGAGAEIAPTEALDAQDLGVSFAGELARLHGGDLQLGGKAGQGVLASFTLPAETGESRHRPDRPADLHPRN